MTDEIRLDEVVVNKALAMVDVGGECEHRMLYQLINQLAEMGYRHRAEYRIILFNGEYSAEFDDDYAEYLDKKAQRQDVDWPDSPKEESE